MMIRFLIDTVSSLTDVNGNRYHFATITSTKTGNTLRIKDIGGESNACRLVRKHAEWSEIHSTQSDMKIRDFRRARKFYERDSGMACIESAKYEHEITAQDVQNLEAE